MKISLKSISLAAGICLFSITGAHAEYYLVYPATTRCCVSCSSACTPCAACQCNTCATACHKTATYTKRLYHDSWRDQEGKRSHYSIDAIEPTCVIDSCKSTRRCGNNRDYVMMRYDTPHPKHPHYVKTANDPYDPDMTTADDEVMVDSDMNNQY